VQISLTGPSELTRDNNGSYALNITPSIESAVYRWKFIGGDATITEETTNNIWSGTIVTGGTVECTVVLGNFEFTRDLTVTVHNRDWKMAMPPSAQEVTAPAWGGKIGYGEGNYQVNNEITGSPGYVSSGPNKGFYYILENNYWENWTYYHWWITPGFRSTSGTFWVKTKTGRRIHRSTNSKLYSNNDRS
jgi:hypothetical protein